MLKGLATTPQLLVCLLTLASTGCVPDYLLELEPSQNTQPAQVQDPVLSNGQAPNQSQTPNPSQAQAQSSSQPVARGGQLDMSAHTNTILDMSRELIELMDDVHNKRIMNPPLKVSDVRNALMGRLTWIEEMSADEVDALRQATQDLDSLIAEIRSHEKARGDAPLNARLKKLEDWNQSIKTAMPK